MEKGPSTYAEYWTSEFREIKHFYDHAHEFGFNKITDYSEAAMNFANNTGRGVKAFKAYNGSIYKYNPKTNEFCIVSREGKIVTYFKPEQGITYFETQFYEWGEYYIN